MSFWKCDECDGKILIETVWDWDKVIWHLLGHALREEGKRR